LEINCFFGRSKNRDIAEKRIIYSATIFFLLLNHKNFPMKRILLLFIMLWSCIGFAQRNCGTNQKLQQMFAQNPGLEAHHNQVMASIYSSAQFATESTNQTQNTATVVTVPVVFHILYKNATQNVSDDQINSQLTVLNDDYRKLNTDFTDVVPTVFQPYGADLEIAFVMATTDPDGNPTTGITRKSIATNFDFDDNYYASTGEPAWDPDHYLNIWVGKFSDNTLLGFAWPPSVAGQPYDGLCISYTAFGTEGTAESPYDLGRTATHEIGHYFGLKHPWGDDNSACGSSSNSDGVADTPATSGPYSGCPSFPSNLHACTTSTNGSMFMNYMDYVDDACMAFFTTGQKTITQEVISNERAELLGTPTYRAQQAITVYPNPASQFFMINSPNIAIDYVEVYNANGQLAKSQKLTAGNYKVATDDLSAGTYYLRIYNAKKFLKSDKIIKK
jgi:hypothetical protein